MKNRPIGIFDSGVGGLTVLREIEKLLPFEDIVYLGDTARVPYGNKSKPTIIKFSRENADFLKRKRVKMIVVACNTSSALALESLKKSSNIPVLGVIEAGVEKAVALTRKKRIAVIGTKSTIQSNSYQKLIAKRNKNIKVYSKSCPLFVPLVEEGILNGKIVKEAMKMYLKGLNDKGIDVIILGCTHYPLLKHQIFSYLRGVVVIDSAKEVASYVRSALKSKNLLSEKRRKSKVEFYLSDEPKRFVELAKLFLKRKISNPRIVNV